MTMEIPLTQGKVALVDDEDYPEVSRYRWYANRYGRRWYAVRNIGRYPHQQAVLLHRFLASPPEGMQVDHKNGDGLDCRRENIRVCTPAENLRNKGLKRTNTSGFKGVQKCGKRWKATIRAGRDFNLGHFDDIIDAARAYDAAARVHHGEFAWLNFPEDR